MPTIIRREHAARQAPFTFQDVERRAEDILSAAREEAQRIVFASKLMIHEETARRGEEGYAAGVAKGRIAGMELIRSESWNTVIHEQRARLQGLADALLAMMRDFDSRKRALIADAESGLIELALEIARRICKNAVARGPEVAVANAAALLDLVRGHDDVELHVSPTELDLIREVLPKFVKDADKLAHIRLTADEAIDRGGAALHTVDGIIDASISTQLDRVAAALSDEDTK